MRVAKSLETLRMQVDSIWGRGVSHNYGEVDGLDVIRSAQFDAEVSDWLRESLRTRKDRRLVSVEDGPDGTLIATVTWDSRYGDSKEQWFLDPKPADSEVAPDGSTVVDKPVDDVIQNDPEIAGQADGQ